MVNSKSAPHEDLVKIYKATALEAKITRKIQKVSACNYRTLQEVSAVNTALIEGNAPVTYRAYRR
jgi:hypothetical protein